MATLVSVAEAVQQTSYTHEHINWLVRKGKVAGRKAGTFWLVDLESLKAYETRMKELGSKKHSPISSDSP
jgi:hypothetical protein